MRSPSYFILNALQFFLFQHFNHYKLQYLSELRNVRDINNNNKNFVLPQGYKRRRICNAKCIGTLLGTMYDHFTFLTKSLSRICSLTAWKSKATALFSQIGLIRAICFRQANIELDLFTPSSSLSSLLSDGFTQHNKKIIKTGFLQ